MSVFALILFSVQSFALLPILRPKLQVRCTCCSVKCPGRTDWFFLGRTGFRSDIHHTGLRRHRREPVLFNIDDCHDRFLPIGILYYFWRSCGPDLGSTVQAVSRLQNPVLSALTDRYSEIRGPWDVAVPRVR